MRQKSKKQQAFLEALRKWLGVAPAADAACVSRATVYRWRSEDPDFAKAWDDAIEAALDDVEKSLHERAKTKDTLAAIAILRNRRRAIYNDTYRVEVEHHNPPSQHSPADTPTVADAIRLLLDQGKGKVMLSRTTESVGADERS